MARNSPHPTILTPASRFAAQIYSTPSRSPSRSPNRPEPPTPRDIDPLLSNLSPTSTLEALRTTDAYPLRGHQQHALSGSIADASTSERVLAVRAALAGKKLKEWYAEVKEWQWPGNAFEEPSQAEKRKKYRESDDSAYLDEVLAAASGAIEVNGYGKSAYWGSLPAHTVEAYESRIEAIKDELDVLDVEELKEHVRGAHIHQKKHLTSYIDSPTAAYSRLDDLTVVITATIMQALPYLARLSSLLDVWSIRIVVLRQVPGFLRQLEDARIAVDSACSAISRPTSSADGTSDLTRDGYATMKYVLQDRVSELGQRIDYMLDSLEGSADSIPDHWIDSMEKVQEDYETWVVDAERQVEENEWRFHVEAAKQEATLKKAAEDAANMQDRHSSQSTDLARQVTNKSAANNHTSENFEPQSLGNTGEYAGLVSDGLHSVETMDPARPTLGGAAVAGRKVATEISQPTSPTTDVQRTRRMSDNIHSSETMDDAPQLTNGSESRRSTSKTTSTDSTATLLDDGHPLQAMGFAKSIVDRPVTQKEGLETYQPVPTNTGAESTGPKLHADHFSRAEDFADQVLNKSAAKTKRPEDRQRMLSTTSTESNGAISDPVHYSWAAEFVRQTPNEPNAKSEINEAGQATNMTTAGEGTKETSPHVQSFPGFGSSTQVLNESTTMDLTTETDQMASTTATIENGRVLSHESCSSNATDLAREIVNRFSSEEFPSKIRQPKAKITKVESTRAISGSRDSVVTGAKVPLATINRLKPLPATPPGEAVSEYTIDLSLHSQSPFASNDGAFSIREPSLEENLLDDVSEDKTNIKEPLRNGRRSQNHRPPPLELQPRSVTNDDIVSTDSSNPASPVSNMSSPEILDASRVEYFKTPIEEMFRINRDPGIAGNAISRNSSERTERDSGSAKEAGISVESKSPNLRSRASSFLPEDTIFEDLTGPVMEKSDKANARPDLGLKRASIASIEVLPRSELRNITVIRSSSQSSNSSGLSRRQDRSSASEAIVSMDSSMHSKELTTERLALSRTSSDDSDSSQSLRVIKHRPNPTNDISEYSLCSPLSLPPRTPSMAETPIEEVPTPVEEVADRFVNTGASSPEPGTPSPAPEGPKDLRSPSKHHRGSSQSIEDQLTARITSILTSIPAHIRLASGPDSEIPDVIAEEELPESKDTNPVHLPVRVPGPRSATPSITLAPAFSKTSKTKLHSSDSDIKLYHLHQPGKDAPIKLYVRLVGEAGERVMVRVGGGWADLGEYLKDYASHHGRRSVSDGRFEIKGLPAGQPSSSIATLVGRSSGRTTPTSRPESPVMRPNSSHNVRKARIPSTPLPNIGNPSTPEVRIRSFDATPGSVDSNISARSSSFTWADDDTTLGMAGPKSKKGDISPSKKAWVDVMLDQARKASAEKRKVSAGEFGDLGKVGGTRRIFLKAKAEE